MKTGTVIVTIGVVVIIIIVGMVAFRPQDTVAPTPTPTMGFEDTSEDTSVIDFGAALEGDVDVNEDAATPTPVSETNEAAAGTTESELSANISVDEEGFTPSTLTIAAGTTVTFVNNGQALHWPASDIHPTHQILPEFDSKKGIATGGTYSFTFTQVGQWPMHDHLQPTSTGTIIVQ